MHVATTMNAITPFCLAKVRVLLAPKLNVFKISLREYEVWCLGCECVGSGNIHLHGFYWRYGITEEMEVEIPIHRMWCLNCKVTI